MKNYKSNFKMESKNVKSKNTKMQPIIIDKIQKRIYNDIYCFDLKGMI